MQHAGGVAWLDTSITVDDLKDKKKFANILASQPHNYNGTKTRAYHSYTRGWYLNEVVRRVDPQGRSIGQIIQEEINTPYNVEWYYSPGPELDHRMAKPYTTPLHQLIRRAITPAWLWKLAEPLPDAFRALADQNSVVAKALHLTSPDKRDLLQLQNPDLRPYESPSFSGHTNARSVSFQMN
jgi:hypothetical protein